MPLPDLAGLICGGGVGRAVSAFGLAGSTVGFAASIGLMSAGFVSAGFAAVGWAAGLLDVPVVWTFGVGVTTSMALRSSVAWGRLLPEVSDVLDDAVPVGPVLPGFGASGALSFLSIVMAANTPTRRAARTLEFATLH